MKMFFFELLHFVITILSKYFKSMEGLYYLIGKSFWKSLYMKKWFNKQVSTHHISALGLKFLVCADK